MLTAKQQRLKELLELKEKTDAEIDLLTGGTPAAGGGKRGRPRKADGEGHQEESNEELKTLP